MTDLRDQLVAAGVALLAEDGLEAVSLRAIARQAGVSHGAPRRHFPTRAALLSAIAAEGFGRLASRQGAALTGRAEPARSRLARACRAYVSFALDERPMFELMFRHDLLAEPEPDLRYTSLPLFAELVAVTAEAQRDGWRPHEDPRVVAGALWAAVHGLATLWLWNALPLATGETGIDRLLAATLAAHLDLAPTDPA